MKGQLPAHRSLLAWFGCWVPILSLAWWCPCRSLAQVSVTNIQTIGRYFITWDVAGDGNIRSCGYYLAGHFKRIGDYTSIGDYTLVVRDAQGRTPRLGWFKTSPGPGEDFAFDIGGTWATGAAGPTPFDCPQPYSVAGMAPWTATLIIRPPSVSFTFNEAAWAPGRVQFQSGASDTKWKDLQLQWSFGDGGQSASVNPAHEYAKPGTYRVVLKATNPPGAWNVRTNTVVVDAPPLSVSLNFVDRDDARPLLGETVKVRAVVRAGRDGLGALSGLAFSGTPALEVPPVFAMESAPGSTSIGTLQPGESREFDWTLKVVRAGRFTLRTAPVTGFDAANRPVTAQGSLPGEVSGLQVEVVFPDKPILLEKKPQVPGQLSSQPGYEPATFPVKVKVSVPTNGEPVKNITLQGWSMSDSGLDIDQMRATGIPQQPWVLMVPQPVPFPLTTQTKPPAATVPGPLGPKDKPLEFDFLVKAERPGSFQFASVFTASSVDGVVGFQERGSGIHPVLGDLVLSVQVAVANEPPAIKEGQTVEVYGRVKNLTDNETILLDPVHIINSGQGVVLGTRGGNRRASGGWVPGHLCPDSDAVG
jgi:PKD repeat protein